MKRLVQGLISLSLLAASPAMASDLSWVRTRVGMGSSIGPATVLLSGSAEGYLDKHLSFGPMIQLGLGSDHTLLIPTAFGRLSMAVPGLEDLDASIHAGLGVFRRSDQNSSSTSFNSQFGLGAEYRVWDTLRVGAAGELNLTSSVIERIVGGLLLTASYGF